RAVVAAEPEALLAADHQETTTPIPDKVTDVVHLRPRKLERRDIGEDDAVVLLQARQNGWELRRLDDGDLDVLRPERTGERLRVAPVPIREQHLGPAAHDDRADGTVVLLDRVAVDLDRRLVDVDAARVERLAVAEHVLARVEPDHLRAEKLAIPEEREPSLRVLVAPRHHLRLERLAVLDLLWKHERLGDDLLREGERRRLVEEVGAGVLRRLRAREGVAVVLAAGGEHADAVGLAG